VCELSARPKTKCVSGARLRTSGAARPEETYVDIGGLHANGERADGGARGLALVVAIATTTGAVIATALPASAQKLYESTRYSSVNQPISNWTTFASDGTPIAKDPNCPSYPGIKRSSKVWATAYGVDEPLHTDFRMQFHTTYSYGTAAAMLSYQNAGLPVSCSIVGLFQNATAQQARTWMTCGYLTQKRAGALVPTGVEQPGRSVARRSPGQSLPRQSRERAGMARDVARVAQPSRARR